MIPRRVACCIILITLVACATVPLTGRRTLAILPESQLAALSVDSYRQVLSDQKLSTDRAEIDRVTRVGRRMATATEQYLQRSGYTTAHLAWEFNVIDADDTVNAFAMPGGKIAVYTGILPIAQDDAGLAVIMGHEIAHAIGGHANERVSQALIVAAGAQGLQVFLRDKPDETKQIVMTAAGALASVGVLLPYSRLHESEADRIGLTLMATAGYDPRAAVPFWQRMNDNAGRRPPEFLSTHPAPQTRIDNINRYLPEAMAVYNSH